MGNPNIITLFLFLPQILTYLAHMTFAQPEFIQSFCIPASGNYTNNSIYRSNLDTSLSSITSRINTTTPYGFSTTSFGRNSETANALALCRGDIDRVTCGQCVYNATLELKKVCPNQKEAIGWYELCMLSYSNRSLLLQNMDNTLVFYVWSQNNITHVAQFNRDLRNLVDTLRIRAAAGGPLRKFAEGNVDGPDFLTIYGLVQCIPILTADDCDRCLAMATRDIPRCCNRRQGGRVVRAGCNLRFEIDPFFRATPPSPP